MSVSIKYKLNTVSLDVGKKAILNTVKCKMYDDIVIAPLSGGSELSTVNFRELTAGTQYANETREINENLTVSTHNKGCHINTQLRIYDSSSTAGWAIIHSTKPIMAFQGNIGYKRAALDFYGSNGDGTGEYVDNYKESSAGGGEWEYIGTINTDSTTYKDYELSFGKAYKHILLDAEGAQLRIATITLTLSSDTGDTGGTGGTVKVIYNDKRIAEFESSKTVTLNCSGKVMQGAVVVILNGAEEAV